MPATVLTSWFQPISSRRSPLRWRAKSRSGPLDCSGNDKRDDVGADEGESAKKTSLMVRRGQGWREESQRSPIDRAHGHQHGISSGHVIVAPLAEEEEGERDKIHEGEHAVTAVEQESSQAGEPEWRGK